MRSRTRPIIGATILTGLLITLSGIAMFAPAHNATSSTIAEYVSTSTIPTAKRDTQVALRDLPEHSLQDVLDEARQLLANLESNVLDYRAVLVKRERISGRLGEETKMEIKVRNRQSNSDAPTGLAAYLKFLAPKAVAGREVIWDENRNEGNLISHEAGFKRLLGRMELAPTGRMAMLGQKYPITEIGLVRLVEKLIEKGTEIQRVSQAEVSITEDQMVGDRSCRLIQVTIPEKSAGVDFHIAQIFVDPERMVPVRYAAYLWPTEETEAPPLEEEYTYLDLELNVALTDRDFDPNNTDYDYP